MTAARETTANGRGRTLTHWATLLVVWAILAPGPAHAFQFSIWRSGMTAEQAVDLAERNDLPLVAEGLHPASPHFDPAVSRARQDTAAAFSYRAEIRERPATVTLSFHPATRRLHTLTIRWDGAFRGSAFAQGVLASQTAERGPPARSRQLFSEDFAWKEGASDRVVLRLRSTGTDLVHVDESLQPASPGTSGRRPFFPSEAFHRFVFGALLLTLLSWLSRQPAVKGWWGEMLVKAELLSLDRGRYRVLHNVTLPEEDGTTQIDHVILSTQGVFVVETKNYSGWIFGSRHDAYWTWKKFRRTEKFRNPLRQNFKHERALIEVCGVPPGAVASVVVFVGGAEFKTEMPENVVRLGQLVRYVQGATEGRLTQADVDALAERIEERRLAPNLRTHFTHVRNLRQAAGRRGGRAAAANRGRAEVVDLPRERSAREMAASPSPAKTLKEESAPACPRCGAATIRRVIPGPSGSEALSWRCSGFPKCGGTVRVESQGVASILDP